MKLVIHIGTPKTGTSAIQQALRRSAHSLAQVGVFYDETSADQNILQTLVRPRDQWDRYFRSQTDVQGVVRKADMVLQRIQRAINSKEYSKVVVSGESLFSLSAEEIERFLLMLDQGASEVETVCFARRPSRHWLSLVQQAAKASGAFPQPSTYRYRLREQLELWEGSRLVCRQVVLPFEAASLAGRSVVSAFVTAVIPEACGVVDECVVSNASLSAEAVVLMHRYRAITHPFQNNVFTQAGTQVLRFVNDAMVENSGTVFRGEASLMDHVDWAHLDQITWLQREYGVSLLSERELERIAGLAPLEPAERIMRIEDVCTSYDADLLEVLQYKVMHRLAEELARARKNRAGFAKYVNQVASSGLRGMRVLKCAVKRIGGRRKVRATQKRSDV